MQITQNILSDDGTDGVCISQTTQITDGNSHVERVCVFELTREMARGMLKSFPPCSLKPQGAGPFNATL